MCPLSRRFGSYRRFKIDVIVWKFLSGARNLLKSRSFKIDVIVWKFKRRLREKMEAGECFKIDVIVWKSGVFSFFLFSFCAGFKIDVIVWKFTERGGDEFRLLAL